MIAKILNDFIFCKQDYFGEIHEIEFDLSIFILAHPFEQTADTCERSRRASSKVVSYKDDSEEEDFVSDEDDSILLRIQKHETKKSSENGEKTKPYIVYEISCEDGFSVQSHDIRGIFFSFQEGILFRKF